MSAFSDVRGSDTLFPNDFGEDLFICRNKQLFSEKSNQKHTLCCSEKAMNYTAQRWTKNGVSWTRNVGLCIVPDQKPEQLP